MVAELTKTELEVKKQPLDIDISKGVLPKSYNELLQFAGLYHNSGLAPKSFTTVQQLAIAIGMCLELERPILTGIQDMAVINGKVSIYGDAALAIVRRSGLLEYIKEREEGKPYSDSWVFTCEIKRKGAPESRKGIWSWEDAKRAGFDSPKTKDGRDDIWSPWTRFTRRMMQFKARNFVLRDEFGDVIKGMTLAEDAQDSIIDVTPTQPKIPETTDKPGEAIYDLKKVQTEQPPKPESQAPERPQAETSEPMGSNLSNEETPPIEEATEVETDVMDEETRIFLEEAQKYEAELHKPRWQSITKYFGVAHKGLKGLAPESRERFISQCRTNLDKQNERK